MSNEPENPVGHDEPLKPAHSLPRYSEPTPETHKKVTREEEAEAALLKSSFAGPSRMLLILLFLLTILSVPAIQFAYELGRPPTDGRLGTFNLYKAYPSWKQLRTVRGPRDLWRLLPRGSELKAAEKELETESIVSEWLLPRVQFVLLQLGAGNEQVYLGCDRWHRWLFYRPDVDYITGPPFLDPKIITHRAHSAALQPDPVQAIITFRDQLAGRGIDLIVFPVPMKPGVEATQLAANADPDKILQNASFADFKARLEKGGVRLFDVEELFLRNKTATAYSYLYLEGDTHWRPETMELVAEKLATSIQPIPQPDAGRFQLTARRVGGVGDIARMLKLPKDRFHRFGRQQTVTTHEVTAGNSPWRASKDADVLLLGDSFANIFSVSALGWGESAGFAEHLSHALGRSIDCILRNSDGAFATREILSRELARGRDRLAGKKLVIWEFAARELAIGDWKMLSMKLGQPLPPKFFVPKAGESVTATGTVETISSVPRPGSVPYQDHILALHLSDLTIEGRADTAGWEALVYVESMRANVLTAAARFRPGDQVTLRLRAWTDVSDRYEKINRTEIDDPSVQLEEPCWGETISN